MASAEMEQWMSLALAQARQALGTTHPNPAVGAVIVHGCNVVATGHTQPPGLAHAERMALQEFRRKGLQPQPDTVLVVTMEPCSTHGRSGACTEAILESGIRRVVIGAIDPNPAHRGRGIEILLDAGIHVVVGVLEDACEDLNLVFYHWMRSGRPLVAGKIATTIDGRIATRGGRSKWITGTAARADVHRWRCVFPAIAVGAGTLRADNPALTARRPGYPVVCPRRFVFDRNLVTAELPDAQVFTDAWRERTTLVTLQSRAAQALALQEHHGISCWLLSEDSSDGGIGEFLERCAAEDLTGILIEGGAQLLTSFLRQRRLDYLFTYRAPKLLADHSALSPFSGFEPGDMQQSIRLTGVRHQVFDDDQLMRGFLYYPT